ncbi:MAG: hypothetical protein CK427_05595 [Leptospira sp.]|nr:MAG: hypothetical protein CK427_05595 [Leptospira sp.]
MSQINYPIALELTSPFEFTEVFDLPTMHIIISKKEDGSISGHCLDYDTWAFSESEDATGIVKVITRLLEMAFILFIDLYQEKRLDDIFENEVTDEAVWNEFRNLIKKNRIASVKKTMTELHSDQMENFANASNLKEDEEKSIYDLSEFSDSEREQIQFWLKELKTSDVNRRKEILHEMLQSIAQKAPILKLVSELAA